MGWQLRVGIGVGGIGGGIGGILLDDSSKRYQSQRPALMRLLNSWRCPLLAHSGHP